MKVSGICSFKLSIIIYFFLVYWGSDGSFQLERDVRGKDTYH